MKNVYWDVEQQRFDRDEGTLYVVVKNFFPRDTDAFYEQSPKHSIKKLHFTDLPGPREVKQCLDYYQKEMKLLDSARERALSEISHPQPEDPVTPKKNLLFRSRAESDKIDLEFDVWFKDATFKLGYVVFERNIPALRQLARFKIENDFLLPEFELIKSYFMKALGTRKFDVKATVFAENGKISGSRATSATIGRINENLIDTIKNARTLAFLSRPFKGDIDKGLFTPDDFFDLGDNEERGNIFDQSEEEILRLLLENSKVRNRKQLEFLSGIRQAPGTKLRFTLHPFFGFVFCVEGEKMTHFIWELLNSHATYIWSLDKGEGEIKLQYRRIEDAINRVRNSGRENYKRAYWDSHIDQDLVFNVIKHEDAGSSLIEGFVKWRHRLNELLV